MPEVNLKSKLILSAATVSILIGAPPSAFADDADASVEEALRAGLADPYWEVRAEAARTAARLAARY